MYKKHHWQRAGPTFYQLHMLFDKHYDEQNELVDVIAMSKGLVASGLNFLARLGNVFLLAAVVPEKHLVDVGEVQPRRGPAIIGADLDRQPSEHLDAVAGSEFVDDRIRLLE